MSMAQCIITGCILYDLSQYRWIRGDLHELGNCYIFNASGCEWAYTEILASGQKVVEVFSFYEKNNVMVFECDEAVFNEAAVRYTEAES